MGLSSISIFPVSDRINGKPPVLRAEGFRADRADHRRPDRAGGAHRRPVQDAEGLRRRREGQSGQDQLFLLGRVRHAARVDGDLRQRRRHQAVPRALPGRRAGGDRAARRPGRGPRFRAGGGDRPDPRRQDARARQLEHRAPRRCCPRSRPSRSSATTPSSTSGPASSRRPRPRLRFFVKLRDAVTKRRIPPSSGLRWRKCRRRWRYLDAPEFQKYWDNDAARLKVALEKIGKVEEK